MPSLGHSRPPMRTRFVTAGSQMIPAVQKRVWLQSAARTKRLCQAMLQAEHCHGCQSSFPAPHTPQQCPSTTSRIGAHMSFLSSSSLNVLNFSRGVQRKLTLGQAYCKTTIALLQICPQEDQACLRIAGPGISHEVPSCDDHTAGIS